MWGVQPGTEGAPAGFVAPPKSWPELSGLGLAAPLRPSCSGEAVAMGTGCLWPPRSGRGAARVAARFSRRLPHGCFLIACAGADQ